MTKRQKRTIFIIMEQNKVDAYLNRRLWKADGIYYFCRLCGDYLHESNFHNDKSKAFGVSYMCKIHKRKDKITEADKEFEYLKMSRITNDDFEQTQILLERMGYKFGPYELPVHEQFKIKYKIK